MLGKNNSQNLKRNVLKELSEGYLSIHKSYKYFKRLSKSKDNIIEPANWLLDNLYLIEKEYKIIKLSMVNEYFKALPISSKKENQGSKIPRIFHIAQNYINCGMEINLQVVSNYINDIQGITSDEVIFSSDDIKNIDLLLNISELWSFPLMLKVGLILNLSKYIEELVSIQKRMMLGRKVAENLIDDIKDIKIEEKVDEDEYIRFFLKEFFVTLRNNSIDDNVGHKFLKDNLNIQIDFNEALFKSDLKERLLSEKMREYFINIRKIENISWESFFDNTSVIEKILKKDPADTYASMDFDSKKYYRHKIEQIAEVINVTEYELTKDILNNAINAKVNNNPQYKCHVGYYIIDEGISELNGCYHNLNEVISQGVYLGINIGGSIILSLLVLILSKFLGTEFTIEKFILSFLLILLPMSEVLMSTINWIVSKTVDIRFIPKFDFSHGIPDENKTIVVIPTILDDKEHVKSLMEKLEVMYRGNNDKNLYFALLVDFNDSKNEEEKEDNEIVEYGLRYSEELNKKYCKNDTDECKFFFLSRKRVYNDKHELYMGRERKRGKLMEFMALIRGRDKHSFNVISSDITHLSEVKFLITLDDDTFMPRETAYKLVGAMAHVLNIPYIKDNRVVRGYGIMQPKIGISLEAKNKTYFSQIFASDYGVDNYSTAYSDTYQDLFGGGSFTGKGIINIDEFYSMVNKTIKENKILSHDLLEGGLARSALVSDVEFIDGYPSTYKASCSRLKRWVRGDWQLIGWLFSRKLSILYKWKIFDNLKRSLIAPIMLITILLSLTYLSSNRVILLSFLILIIPLVFRITDFVVTPKYKLQGTFKNLEQIILIVSFIPYQGFLMIDAILTSLYRVIISKKNLLEWKSSTQIEFDKEKRSSKNSFKAYIKEMWIAPILGLVLIYFSVYISTPMVVYSLVVASLWICSPYFAYYISKDIEEDSEEIKEEERIYLRTIARRTYAYYEDFSNEENNYLAPDNYQEEPFKGVAYRTSPTNIGMGLIAHVIAYDMGYITLFELIDKIDITIYNMRDLEKVNGQYLNWYDTRSKKALYPRYISTVDNGNFLANLWVVKRTLQEVRDNQIVRKEEIKAIHDIYRIIEEENPRVNCRFNDDIKINEYIPILNDIILNIRRFKENISKNSDEISEVNYWADKIIKEANNKISNYNALFEDLDQLYNKDFLEGVPNLVEIIRRIEDNKENNDGKISLELNERLLRLKNYNNKIDNIINEIDEITEEMDFGFLYDKQRKLFFIGYNVEEKTFGDTYYDLLASEARIASFVSIAKNDVPKENWFSLNRSITNAFYTHTLVSWTGTMFEYFMPSLIMKAYPRTLLYETYKGVIKAQRAYAKQKKVPFGISESAFYKFDIEDNYQYKAFGVPGLGLKRGLEDEVVISPYSTLMILPFSKKAAIKNLKRLEKIDAVGRYGFVESVDFTKAREDKILQKCSQIDTDSKEKSNAQFVQSCEHNVDKQYKIVDNSVDSVYKTMNNYKSEQKSSDIDGVDTVDNFESQKITKGNNGKNPRKVDRYDNLQNDNKVNKTVDNVEKRCELSTEKVENQICEKDDYEYIYNDGLRPYIIKTYMVHHLGMSLMALDNILVDNILIKRFHALPEVKATELLLKEKPSHNITFERREDYSLKERYIKSEVLIPRNFENINYKNPQVLLMSNGKYSSMITLTGSGYSKKDDMMIYRYKGDSTSDDSGMFFYIKNLNSNDFWSTTYEPCKSLGENYRVSFKLDKAKFERKDGNIETKMESVISYEDNYEVRKVTVNNLSDKGRSIEITSYSEITLTTFSADVVHPAFSNLFVETEYDEEEKLLIGSRRSRVKGGKVPYVFHKVVVNGESEGEITYETSRINFIGRNRELKHPRAMDNDKVLENTVGTVLDPIMSLRVRIRLEGNEKKEIYFVTGTVDSRNEAINISKEKCNVTDLEELFNKYSIAIQLELRNLNIRSAQANLYQTLASYILFLSSERKNRENSIKNISKHQKDLWAYGISGDLPIIFTTIKEEKNVHILGSIIKLHHYLKIKGIKSDLVIYNEEAASYDEPLQKDIMQEISLNAENNNINVAGGIFVYNKATMIDDVKELLKGICRLYIDCEKGAIINQFNMEELQHNDELQEHDLLQCKYNVKDLEFSKKYLEEYERDNSKLENKFEEDIEIIEDEVFDIEENDEEVSFIDNVEKINSELEEKDKSYYLKEEFNEKNNDSELVNNTNEINYEEYDHDEEIIHTEDVLTGMKNASNKDSEDIVIGMRDSNNKSSEETDSSTVLNNTEVSYELDDLFNENNLDFYNGFGGFNKDDGTYLIKLSNYKNTPAPWINVISNKDFGFHISESGASYTWCGNSRENKITPWSNDYIKDPLGEALYIRDNSTGKYFSISPKPVRDSGDYFIKHKFGLSEFMHTAYDIKGKLEVFVPMDEKVKIQIISLENLSDEDKEISVFYYAKLVLGVYAYDSEKYISTYIEDDFIGGINPYSEYFGNLNAYLSIIGTDENSFSGDRKEFLGIGGEISSPQGLNKLRLSNRCGSIYDPCLVAEGKLKLKKGEKKELVILLGEDERENVKKLINKYTNIKNARTELDNVKAYWSNFLGNIQVNTPDDSINYLLNGWLLYQTLSCRYLSRTAFYQSGGAYGFRDQLQDSMALGVVSPEITKNQILRSASRQYLEGDVQHWWHPVVNSGIRTRFSDDLLWLPYVTAEYINNTGDYKILEEKAPYLEDEPLREGEDERYTIVNESSKEGTIYEHCLKAIEKSLKFGEHNIPLMGSGDWNDGMSTVGNKGKGESVWLGWFLYSILDKFVVIAKKKNDINTSEHFIKQKEFIRENLEKNAWDGGWYRRAYFDDGTPLGSRENPECQIDSLAQSWSIISGATKVINNDNAEIKDRDINNSKDTLAAMKLSGLKDRGRSHYSKRAIEAMEAVDKNLVKRDKSMILLLAPPFNNSHLEPGYIKGYVPGVRENGGQYTHAAVWVILALTKLDLGDKAVKYYNMINPINHTRTELECMLYKVEPYVMAADVYIKEPHGGRGGWSWYTGAAGWMYKVGIEDILGLKKIEGKGYVVDPCVPSDWKEYNIRIKNETEDYNIKVIRSDTNIIKINGKSKEDMMIPRNAGKLEIEVYFK